MRSLIKCNMLVGLLIPLLLEMPSSASMVRVTASVESIAYQQGNPMVPELTLQLENTSSDTTPEVLIWRTGLSIVPAVDARGSVAFASAGEPTDYLFAGSSTPLSIPNLPQSPPPSLLSVSDALFSLTGVELLHGAPKNIVDLAFDVSDDASGTFQLILAPFAGEGPFGSSSWAPVLVFDPMDAMEFENAKAGSSPESRILASIRVMQVPEPSTVFGLAIGLMCWQNRSYRLKRRANRT